jgi:hypothetical protein
MTTAAGPAPRRIAVAFVHGVEISDPHFADGAANLLRRSFRRQGINPDDALVIRPVPWADALEDVQDRMFTRSFGPLSWQYMNKLTRLVTGVNTGDNLALLPAAASMLVRRIPGGDIIGRIVDSKLPQLRPWLAWLPWGGELNYPTLRWLIVHFIGDAVSYQTTNDDRELYDRVHGRFADTLHDLAVDPECGDDAPLCVISHSLGTVVASNYFYDIQNGGPDLKLVGNAIKARIGESPLTRGETLAFFFTLGSPLALWASRFGGFGTPITVPAPQLHNHHKGLTGKWVNVVSRDDVIAYPLRPLGAQYRARVHEEKIMRVGPRWLSWTPLVHPTYWNDPKVIDTVIAPPLIDAWRALNPALAP